MFSPRLLVISFASASALSLVGAVVADKAGAPKADPQVQISAPGAPLAAEKPKAFTLYMGADIGVSVGRELCLVRGVRGSNWVVDFKGEEKLVPTRDTTTGIRILPQLKLAQRSAVVGGFQANRGYTFNNDPRVRLTRGLDRVAAMNTDLISVARDAEARADTVGNKALGSGSSWAGADDQFSSAAIQLAASRSSSGLSAPAPTQFSGPINFSQGYYASELANSQNQSVGYYQQNAASAESQTENGSEPGGRLPSTGLDAVEVEFEISSPTPVRSPYLVTVAYFHPKGSRPGMIQSLVYAREMHEIGTRTSRVQFVEGGYPYDFELREFQLHIFSGSQEIPTSISSRRVELTPAEAFEYLKDDYLGSHKNATVPAAPAMATLPPDLAGRLAGGQFKEIFFVKVSKEGIAEEPYSDRSCTKPIDDPYLQGLVRGIRFNPALSEGRPVDGIAPINLRQLSL
jgi:hypothetical protein